MLGAMLVIITALQAQAGGLPAATQRRVETEPSTITVQPIPLPPFADCRWIAAQDHALQSLVAVCEAAWSMHGSLPNFVCDQTTHRTEDAVRHVEAVKGPPRFEHYKQNDVITAEVTYHNGEEEFNNVTINGRPSSATGVAQGTWTQGEFSPLVMIVLDQRSKPALRYRGEARLQGTPVWVFDYTVERENNRGWVWRVLTSAYYPRFRGEILVDKKTGRLRRLVQEAIDINGWMGLKSAVLTTDYGDVVIAELGSYHLPLRSRATNCWLGARSCSENVLEFHGCRKFAAKAKILDVTQ